MLALRDPNDPRNVKEVLDNLVKQFDNTGSVTLRVNETTTTVLNPKVSAHSKVLLQARNADAATSIATTFISSIDRGSFTITHSNNTSVRDFDYAVIGV